MMARSSLRPRPLAVARKVHGGHLPAGRREGRPKPPPGSRRRRHAVQEAYRAKREHHPAPRTARLAWLRGPGRKAAHKAPRYSVAARRNGH